MQFPESRILREDYPRSEYKPSKEASLDDVVVKGLHFGQRKLFLSEVEFLSAVIESRGVGSTAAPILAVYAGAANGSHLPALFRLFPDVCFALIDPAPFCAEVCQLAEQDDGSVVELVQDYCTDELCLRLARMYGSKYKLYLISDIRSGVPVKMSSNAEHTKMMLRDNTWQKSWCWALRAEAAMLKFHPPYPAVKDTAAKNYEPDDDTPDAIEYLDGRQLFGVWAPKSSSEVRLVVEGPFTNNFVAKQRCYGCLEHEEQCYHYNTHDRYAADCAAERHILERYLKLFPSTFASCEALSAHISNQLHFPLLRPLEAAFTEDHARWMALLCSTRQPQALPCFDHLKNQMTAATVKALVSKYKDSEAIPTEAKAGDIALDIDFWKVFCRGDFPEAYSYPRIRWAFFHLTKGKSQGLDKNNRSSNSRRQGGSGKRHYEGRDGKVGRQRSEVN